MENRDFYEILSVRPDADGSAIQRSYWQLARQYQALAPSDPRAHKMLDDLNDAYAVLGTSQLRDEYDASHLHNEAPLASKSATRGRGLFSRLMGSPGHKSTIPAAAPSKTELGVDTTPSSSQAHSRARTGAAPAPSGRTSVNDLRLSTASIVGRWRKAAAVAPDVLRDTEPPDSTLVDIFQSERDIDEPAEPLTAVLDALRGSKEPVKLS